ncbi:MAG: hypothetical protein ACK4UJ_06490 [Leptonema sp. (in: bacteria)]
MTLKAIHLIRKLERIERDIEEIHNLLQNLQMDREYSGKLKDSLLEEYHRLKNLKSEILKQKIYVPPESLNYIEKLLPEFSDTEIIPNSIEIHSNTSLSPFVGSIQSKEVTEKKKYQESEKNHSKEIPQKKDSKEINAKPKHSPFLFRFQ